MAIVQISRITQRKGLSENLPQLAGAEFGWVIDQRRLFIGNGTIQEGAPAIGNTEILTQYSDIFEIAGRYTYKGEAAGYTVQTGPTPGDPVERTLQSKLDDMASIKDFGATGDGVTDDTDAINRALYQMFCRESNPQVRRSIFFPAGVYRVTQTIKIPPFCKLYGEGARSSVIFLDTTGDSTLTATYVAETADSLQQVYPNIGNNNAVAPTNIEIYDMGFQSAEVLNIFSVNEATNVLFQDVAFIGPLVAADLDTDADDIAGAVFGSTVTYSTENISFTSCEFTGLSYGLTASATIAGIAVTDSTFDTLYQGVLLEGTGAGTAGYVGPQGFRITQNLFNTVYAEGIKIDGAQNNMSGFNMFLDVATKFRGGAEPATDNFNVILINTDNNVSFGDMFERTNDGDLLKARINISGKQVFALDSGTKYQFGYYNREAGDVLAIVPGSLPATRTLTLQSEYLVYSYEIKYQYRVPLTERVRFGTISIVSEDFGDSSANPVAWTDDYTENGSTGLSFTITQVDNDIVIVFNTVDTGNFKYSISYLS
jgi:hypothetical protein